MITRVFRAFQYRDFRLMWLGACTSSVGTWMQKLAQSWLVLQLSNSPFMLGLDAFLGEIPIFLFSLVGGVVADRMDRRTLLIVGQVIQMSCAFTLATLFALDVVRVWHILCLSFIVGFAQAFGGPAYAALLPTLVKPADLPNAIAMNSIQFNLARVIGPMLGGLALTYFGAVWCFTLNGLSFLAVIASLAVVTTRFVPCHTGESILASMKHGISFIRRQGGMEALIVLAFCMTALGIPLVVFLPVFARDVFRQGPNIYTLFLSISGAGSVCGALLVAVLGYHKRKGLFALAGLILFGIAMTGFAASKNLTLSCVLLFVAGGALIAVFALVTSLVQLITTDAVRGRVMSVYNVAFRGGVPIGSLLTGALVPIFTAPLVLGVAGVLMVFLGLYFLLVHRRIAAL
ncbi:MAG: MFS transporter [Bryobacteraceae bacterium]|nr:MFS transporter [Bryobacteraceae bacterium]